MASTYKTFSNNDLATTRTLLHEVIPITGSIVSGTYVEGTTNETNIKNYSHGMFQSVYDYPYLSSSANHIFDITAGFASDSSLSKSAPIAQQMQPKKINIYNQMAQLLLPPANMVFCIQVQPLQMRNRAWAYSTTKQAFVS